MKKKDAIDHFGSVAALADALKITPEAIYQWGEDVPSGREYQIQVITSGKLIANAESTAREASA